MVTENVKLTQQINHNMQTIESSAQENNNQITTVAGIMQEISKGAEHVARVVSSLFKRPRRSLRRPIAAQASSIRPPLWHGHGRHLL